MIKDFKINNVVVSARIPLKRKLREEEVKKLIERGRLNWNLILEELSPRLQAIIEKPEKKSNGKNKRISITFWFSNKINLVGAQSKAEAIKYLEEAYNDLHRIVRGAFNETKHNT